MHTDSRTLDEKFADRDAKLDALQAMLNDAPSSNSSQEDW